MSAVARRRSVGIPSCLGAFLGASFRSARKVSCMVGAVGVAPGVLTASGVAGVPPCRLAKWESYTRTRATSVRSGAPSFVVALTLEAGCALWKRRAMEKVGGYQTRQPHVWLG